MHRKEEPSSALRLQQQPNLHTSYSSFVLNIMNSYKICLVSITLFSIFEGGLWIHYRDAEI